ncbi:NnrU family protein [Ideonella sp. DXS29W]|uniref:NnrU family protein n=1 Tax=Ideonella lacteola TaxID=2984193 RepID=A0ABU9BM37_9BURK
MAALVWGLVLFLGMHSVRIVAPAWREAQMARLGRTAWRGLYSAVSLVGFALLVWGYGQARQQPVVLWQTPVGLKHLAPPLVLVAFILLAASQVGGNAIQARLQHPMLLGTKLWAFAHLLANNTLADLVLFGGFLVWAIVGFRSARRRGPVQVEVKPARTAVAVLAGCAAWAFFAFWAHAAWIGVRPF